MKSRLLKRSDYILFAKNNNLYIYTQLEKNNTMWHKLQAYPPYFILVTQKHGFEAYVTDYVTIWFVYFTDQTFLKCLQDSNFGLEEETNELIRKGTDLLLHPAELKNVIITKSLSSLEVSMNKSFEYTLKIKFNLAEGSKEMFFQHISHKLLKTISDLKSSEQELRDLLKKKDDEIDEYKCEGKEIALRYLKTKRFNDNDHMKRHQVIKENWELLDVPDTLLQEVAAAVNKKELIEQVRLKNLQIKLEPQATETQSEPCLTTSSGLKQELKVKSESNSPRKKRKPLLNY